MKVKLFRMIHADVITQAFADFFTIWTHLLYKDVSVMG